MKIKKLKKEKKNKFFFKYKKTNKHIYLYICFEKKILFSCSTVEKKFKNLNLKNNFYSIEIISKVLISKLKNRNIIRINTIKKKNTGKYNFLLNILKKENFM
ncbi:hypothetical protein [Candidatus Vidania fulgoroideorum]